VQLNILDMGRKSNNSNQVIYFMYTMQAVLEIEQPAAQTFSSQLLRGGSSRRRMAGSNDASHPKDWVLFTTCVGVWFLAALTLKLCCMKFLDDKVMRHRERDFEVAISEAEAKTQRRQQEQKPSPQTSSVDASPGDLKIPEAKFEFYDSDFLLTYIDENTKALSAGFARLTMTNNGTGYTISGMFADASSAQIHDGFVAYSGDAWWVTYSNDDDKLRVLSTGTFNFGTNRFHGMWRDNRGNRGKYIKFESTRAFISSSKETPVTTNPLTSEDNIRRGSSMFLGSTNRSLHVRDGDDEEPLPSE